VAKYSKCTIESMGAIIGVMRKQNMPLAQEYALELVQRLSADQARTLSGMSKVKGAHSGEGLSKAITSLLNRIRSKDVGDRTMQWTSEAGLLATAKVGGAKGASEVIDTNLMNQHALAGMHAELTGMARATFTAPRAGVKDFKPLKPNEPIPTGGINDLIDRGILGVNTLRADGIPFVTSKAVGRVADEFHASHLTVFDVMDVMRRDIGPDSLRVLQSSMFRNADQTQNISSQSLAEAVRRIIQHADEGKLFTDAGDLKALREAVVDGLSKVSGKPVNETARKLIAKNDAWVATPAGQKAVNELADLLTSEQMLTSLLTENTKQRLIMAALAKGDGFRMTTEVLGALGNVPGNFDQAYGLGSLLMGKGLRDIFRSDVVAKMTPDQMNVAWAEHGLAKLLNDLHPAVLAEAAERYKNVTGIEASMKATKAAGKVDKSPRNRTKRDQMANQKEDIAKLTDDQIKNDHNFRAVASSEEEARLALGFYNEIQYGMVMGGAVKLISKVFDPAEMTKTGKVILQSTEGRLLETAVSMSASLGRLRNQLGRDPERINRIFTTLQQAPTNSADDIAAAIARLPEADQKAAEEMMRRIDDIFGNGNVNNMMGSGIFVDEYAASLRQSGLREYADLFDKFGDIDPGNFQNYWKQLELLDGQDALSIMSKFYNATQISQIKPTLAASLINNFGHQAYGMTRAEALAQGFKSIDDTLDFGKYLRMGKEPALFPPEMFKAINAMNRHLDFERGFGGMSDFIQKMDAVTSVMKSSITIWRPGHHMVNLVGGALMNALEGVHPADYVTAIKMLKKRGKIDGAEDRFLARILASQLPEGNVFKGDPLNGTVLAIRGANGKVGLQNIDIEGILRGADGIGNVPIAERYTRDVVGRMEDVGDIVRSTFMESPPIRAVRGVDNQLARASAARDNFLRYALFNKVLRTPPGGAWNSLEEAFLTAAQKVHEYHPTVGTLTAWERKYARRVFYFYTWQKQALFKIMEFAAASPGGPAILSMPSKFQFALAEAQGLNPASFGDPYDPSKIFAAYNSESVYGPQWEDERWGLMGVKPALPQADILDAYLGKFQAKPEDGLWGNIGNMTSEALTGIVGENLPPLVKMPAELLTRRRVGGIGGEIDNFPEYLLDQTGLGTPSRMADMTPWGAPRSDTRLDPFSEENRRRLWWNWVLGMKVTFYESPASLNVGRQEQIDYWRKTLGYGQYAPKMSLWEFRESQKDN
jgi:hypothetical protein